MWNWIKNLFKKKAAPPVPQAPQPAPVKGWDPYWTELLKRLVYSNVKTFNLASDIHNIRPDWSNLTDEQKSEVMAAFFKALAYFESGYNPLSESVDVGTPGNKETWSVGLLQLSGVDKSNLGLPIGWDYEGLKNPENNLTQGIAIMVNQIKKRGKILIPKSEKGNPGVYFATLNPGNKYDKSALIVAAAQAVKFEKTVEIPAKDDVPWMKIAMGEVGVTELNNPKRVIEYHQATTLKANDTTTAWCSSFANWVLQQAKYKSTKSAWARDWLKYGDISDLQKGCIVVLERNAPGGDSHVGFFTGKETDTHIELLSGNSSNSVCIKLYPKRDILGKRWPVKDT